MLGWIQHRRPGVPIVLIVRHPLAVIASRTKLPGLDWSDDREALDDLLAQPALVADHLGPFVNLIASVTDRFDQQMVLWCIEQMVPLRQAPAARIHLVRYEDCLAQPHHVLPELFAHTNVELTQRVFDGLARPSATSWNGPGFSDALHHTEKWRSEFTASQVQRAHELMGIFGLGHLYPPDRIETDRIETGRVETVLVVADPRATARIEMSLARVDDPVSELPPLAS